MARTRAALSDEEKTPEYLEFEEAQRVLEEKGKKLVEPLVNQLKSVQTAVKQLQKNNIDLKDLKKAVRGLNRVLNPEKDKWWEESAVDAWLTENAKGKSSGKRRSEVVAGLADQMNGAALDIAEWNAYASDTSKIKHSGEKSGKQYYK